MYILMTKGLKQSVCDQSFYNGPVSKFWAYAFVLSKAPELGKSQHFYGKYHIVVYTGCPKLKTTAHMIPRYFTTLSNSIFCYLFD